jgi:hypothetical protein
MSSLGRSQKLELLFRASEHGFDAQKFHQSCDNIQDTVTLVRTSKGKTIAGYSHREWINDEPKASEQEEDSDFEYDE